MSVRRRKLSRGVNETVHSEVVNNWKKSGVSVKRLSNSVLGLCAYFNTLQRPLSSIRMRRGIRAVKENFLGNEKQMDVDHRQVRKENIHHHWSFLTNWIQLLYIPSLMQLPESECIGLWVFCVTLRLGENFRGLEPQKSNNPYSQGKRMNFTRSAIGHRLDLIWQDNSALHVVIPSSPTKRRWVYHSS